MTRIQNISSVTSREREIIKIQDLNDLFKNIKTVLLTNF